MKTIRTYLKNIGTKAKNLTKEFKGLYTAFGEEGCPEGFSPYMENISAVSYPVLSPREGRECIGEFEGEILHLGVLEGKYPCVIEDLDTLCTLKYFDGEWKDICYVVRSDTGRYDMIHFIDKTVVICGSIYTIDDLDKSTTFTVYFENGEAKWGVEYKIPYSDMVETINGRLAVACTDGSKIFLGGAMDRGVWYDIDDGLEVNMITQNCENISAIRTFGDHLICFKPHAFGELYGNTPDTYTLIMASESVGCLEEKTICDCGSLLWLSEEGICSYGGGSLPKIISSPVQKYIDNLDRERLSECCAGCDGTRYIISLPQKDGSKINLVLNIEKGTFVAEDDTDFRFFKNICGTLYGATAEGKVLKLWQSCGEDITWQWHSPIYKMDPVKKTNLRRIYINGDFEGEVNARVTNNKGEDIIVDKREGQKGSFYINLHPSFFSGCDTFQIHISGSGRAQVRSITTLMRNRNISY